MTKVSSKSSLVPRVTSNGGCFYLFARRARGGPNHVGLSLFRVCLLAEALLLVIPL